MKKLTLKKLLYVTLLIVLITGSCKKDKAIDDPLIGAKTWYINFTSKSKLGLQKNAPSEIGIKVNKEVMKNISHDVNWSKSKSYLLEDGTELVTAPMSIEIDGAPKPKGGFLLLIYKKANGYETLVAYNENKDYFQRSFSAPEMQVIFSSTLAENLKKTAYKKGINTQVKVRPNEPPVCIDYYWIVYVEDEYGNITDILSVTYLYTSCEEYGGSGVNPDPDPDPEPTIEWGDPESYGISDMVEVNDTVKNVSWYCYHAAGSLHFKSYDIIKASINNIGLPWSYTKVWKIRSAVHNTILTEGSITGQDASPELAYWEDNSDEGVARIKLVFKDHRTYAYRGVTTHKYSSDKHASNAWTKANLGWQDREMSLW